MIIDRVDSTSYPGSLSFSSLVVATTREGKEVGVDFPGLDFQTYEILETIPCSARIFVYLAGFVCGISLHIP